MTDSSSPRTPWKLYGSRLISSWGDRMWSFAVGLFMIELSPGSLQWPAIYGLTVSLSVVFCGSTIGRWVDQNPRWKGNPPLNPINIDHKTANNSLMDSRSHCSDSPEFIRGSLCSVRGTDLLLPVAA